MHVNARNELLVLPPQSLRHPRFVALFTLRFPPHRLRFCLGFASDIRGHVADPKRNDGNRDSSSRGSGCAGVAFVCPSARGSPTVCATITTVGHYSRRCVTTSVLLLHGGVGAHVGREYRRRTTLGLVTVQ